MRVAQREAQLHLVVDSTDFRVSFGPLQIAWLLQHGHIEHGALDAAQGVNWYRAVNPDDARGIHDLVLAQPELRECDFCRQLPTFWAIHVRRFKLTCGPAPGPIERPMFACDVCAGYIERNEKDRLVEYAIASTVEHARAQGGYLQAVVEGHPWGRLKAELTPMVKEIVYGMFANRRGRPERIEGSRG